MATLDFFDFVDAEAGEGGDVWLRGGKGEAGLQFPAGDAGAAARIAAAINSRSRPQGHGVARGVAEAALAPGNAL